MYGFLIAMTVGVLTGLGLSFGGVCGIGWSIGLGHSWKNSRENRTVCIGQVLIPGALFLGRETYERLFERIKKCHRRKEVIRLSITDKHCRHGQPLRHWEEA